LYRQVNLHPGCSRRLATRQQDEKVISYARFAVALVQAL
jgi:hypothetical protein